MKTCHNKMIQQLSAVAVVAGLFGLAFADEPNSGLKCSDKAEKYFQAHRDSYKRITLDATLKGAPSQWLDFLKSETDAARTFAEENAGCLDAFIRSVHNGPFGEEYGFGCENLNRDQYYKEQIRPKEDALSKKLQDYIRLRPGLYSATIAGSKYELLLEGYIPPGQGWQEKSRQWRHSSPPLETEPLLPLLYGQKTTDPTACQITINQTAIPQTEMCLTIPVFLKGRYVCDIWFNYCLCAQESFVEACRDSQ